MTLLAGVARDHAVDDLDPGPLVADAAAIGAHGVPRDDDIDEREVCRGADVCDPATLGGGNAAGDRQTPQHHGVPVVLDDRGALVAGTASDDHLVAISPADLDVVLDEEVVGVGAGSDLEHVSVCRAVEAVHDRAEVGAARSTRRVVDVDGVVVTAVVGESGCLATDWHEDGEGGRQSGDEHAALAAW